MKGMINLWVCLAFAVGTIAGSIGGMMVNAGPASAKTTNTLMIAEPDLIRFIVDGREQAYLDKTGMYVNGDIAYSGAIRDSVDYTYADSKTDNTGHSDQGDGK